MTDHEREQRREAERRERIERETIDPHDEPVGVYDRGERRDEPGTARGRLGDLVDEGREGVERAGERVGEGMHRAGEQVDRIGDRVDPFDDRSQRVDERGGAYNRPAERVGSSSGLWLTVGIIVLVVIALIVVMLLLPLL